MDSIFLLGYVHARTGADDEDFLIGVYSTENEAKAATNISKINLDL